MTEGLRVVRGPDWEWGDQDGGEGYVGTVAGLEGDGGAVIVQWDTGQRCRYRCGEEGKHDLRILDSGPSGAEKPSYVHVPCNWCLVEKICGLVWRCAHCLDYHLCSQCYMAGRHSVRHQFFRLHDDPVKRVKVLLAARSESKKFAARGIFPGAQVVRGVDWRWGDQDGGQGTVGKVVCIRDWKNDSQRSTAEVRWTKTSSKRNVYRIGHHGKVDLKCIEGTNGMWYYPDHLPVLDPLCTYVECDQPTQAHKLVTGDVVTLELDFEIVKLLQQDHGGWNDMMAELVGEIGLIVAVYDGENVLVRCPNNGIFTFNPEAVTKVDIPFLLPGDVVRVLDDIGRVHDLQEKEIGWLDDMALSLGQVGCVVKRAENGRKVHVTVNGKRWIYNAKCIIPAPEEELPHNDDYEDVDLHARLQMVNMLRQKDERDTIPYATAAGDIPALKKTLQKYPQEVDRKVLGKSSLQVACMEHYHSALKVVLQYQPDLELLSDGGLRALHFCSYVNNSVAAKILLDHGADVNGRASDMQGSTPLMIAAGVGHNRTLKVLLEHPDVDINAGNSVDSTALHCAVVARRNSSVQYLMEAGSDPSRVNFTGATPLHDAVGYALLPAVEQMIIHRPDLINFTKEDGYAPLHMAAANNRVHIADFLAQQSSCDLNLRVKGDLTALMIAAHEGHTATVELLVGHGADLNVAALDGRTALHLVISRKNMAPIDKRTPFLMEVQANIESDHNEPNFDPYLIVACMLVREGAELHIKDIKGESPLQLCSAEEAAVIKSHAQKYSRSFHGSLHPVTAVELPKPHKRRVQRTEHVPSSGESVKIGKMVEKKASVKNEQNLFTRKKSFNMTSTGQETDLQLQATAGNPGSNTVDPHSATSTGDLSTNNASDVKTGAGSDGTDEDICCMCDKRIDVKLPCGHSVMCSECMHTAKRCPTCLAPIEGSTPLI